MLIDIHTHQQPDRKDTWRLGNFYKDFEQVQDAAHCSVGLHPWYLEQETWQHNWQTLEQYAALPQVVAIGECGLDRVCNTDWALQESVFIQHIQLANKLGKPLVIHCVRAYNEVMQLLEKTGNSVPVVFHGFNRSKALAKQITGRGYYIAIGKAALNPTFHATIRTIPQDKILLETDDAPLDISIIYQSVATALEMDIAALETMVQKNATDFLGKHFSTL